MRPIDADALEATIGGLTFGGGDLLHTDDVLGAIRNAPTEKVEPVVDGIWQYYVNDEGKARWRCDQCGKICRRDPHDKHRCASCGAHMRKEA